MAIYYPVDEYKMYEQTGRPFGSERYKETAESLPGRDLRKKKPDPKIKDDNLVLCTQNSPLTNS